MKAELLRVASYQRWQGHSSVSPLSLARNGFYYLESGDEIECVHCKTRLIGWNGIYNPLEKHEERAPGCGAHVNGDLSRNANTERSAQAIVGDLETDDPGMVHNDHFLLQGQDNMPSGSLLVIQNAAKAPENKWEMSRKNPGSHVGLQQSSPDFERLKIETERLSTFNNWPASDIVDPYELAKQGFFYAGSGDRVQCAFCKGFVLKWKLGDIPAVEHKKHHPGCPFVLGTNAENPPNVLVEEAVTANPVNEVDACVVVNRPSKMRSLNWIQNSALLVERQQPPKFPKYMDVSRRQKSFRYRTIGQGQTAEGLADAGFFYVGPGDKVQCFQCGGKVKDWEQGDDPWEEHRGFYDHCPYIQTHPTIPVGIGRYRIKPKDVEVRMDTPTVRAILNMGYSRDLVKAAIETKLSTTGDDFQNIECLLEAVFALEDTTAASSETVAPTGGTSATVANVFYNTCASEARNASSATRTFADDVDPHVLLSDHLSLNISLRSVHN